MTPYRAVIGLAGHVDHGKTLLIKALTGITTARAHEQAIGMTQDLGFAHFDDGQGNTIGVIDVPGHERYIRNMVAGLWSLDSGAAGHCRRRGVDADDRRSPAPAQGDGGAAPLGLYQQVRSGLP